MVHPVLSLAVLYYVHVGPSKVICPFGVISPVDCRVFLGSSTENDCVFFTIITIYKAFSLLVKIKPLFHQSLSTCTVTKLVPPQLLTQTPVSVSLQRMAAFGHGSCIATTCMLVELCAIFFLVQIFERPDQKGSGKIRFYHSKNSCVPVI